MPEIAFVVEGETEKAFVERQLRPHFDALGIRAWATLPGRVRQRGGVRSWPSVRQDILRHLKQRSGRYCTTMFDYYGLPQDWPGKTDSANLGHDMKGSVVEAALSDDFASFAGGDFRRELFIPYLQIHEFEAVLFSDCGILAHHLATRVQHYPVDVHGFFRKIVEECGSPEAINDGVETAPSKRILAIAPCYSKRIDGPIIAERIGLPEIRQRCTHFDQWISRLETLAVPATQ